MTQSRLSNPRSSYSQNQVETKINPTETESRQLKKKPRTHFHDKTKTRKKKQSKDSNQGSNKTEYRKQSKAKSKFPQQICKNEKHDKNASKTKKSLHLLVYTYDIRTCAKIIKHGFDRIEQSLTMKRFSKKSALRASAAAAGILEKSVLSSCVLRSS